MLDFLFACVWLALCFTIGGIILHFIFVAILLLLGFLASVFEKIKGD